MVPVLSVGRHGDYDEPSAGGHERKRQEPGQICVILKNPLEMHSVKTIFMKKITKIRQKRAFLHYCSILGC